jgi:flagellar motor switch protein FliN/FliY
MDQAERSPETTSAPRETDPAAREASPVSLPSFASSAEGGAPQSIELIRDVPLRVTVELGRARLLVRDVLALRAGSVVELDRQAGAPVDILVNGVPMARGEVVVVDERFGVRITEVIGTPTAPPDD